MKCIVIGGAGFIGSNLIKRLLKVHDNRVTSLDNYTTGKIENQHKGCKYIHGDIRDYKRCVLATKNIDIVIHAAALKHVPICEYNKDEAYKTNVIGTKFLIKASIKNKVKKFLFISTDKAAEPTSIMGKSKLAAEKLVIQASKKKN